MYDEETLFTVVDLFIHIKCGNTDYLFTNRWSPPLKSPITVILQKCPNVKVKCSFFALAFETSKCTDPNMSNAIFDDSVQYDQTHFLLILPHISDIQCIPLFKIFILFFFFKLTFGVKYIKIYKVNNSRASWYDKSLMPQSCSAHRWSHASPSFRQTASCGHLYLIFCWIFTY